VAQPIASPTANTTLTPPVTAPTTAASAAQPGPGSGPSPAAGRGRWWGLAGLVGAGAVVAALWLPSGGRVPATGPDQEVQVAAEEVRRARVRFDARDYRAALAEATAALTHDPGSAEAAKIKGDAEARLAELEGLLEQASRAIAANDGVQAAGLLARAQELAPGDGRVAEVAARLREVEPPRRAEVRPEPRPLPPPPAARQEQPTSPPVRTGPAAGIGPPPATPPPLPPPVVIAPPPVVTAPPPTVPPPPAVPTPEPAKAERRPEPEVETPPPAPAPARAAEPPAPAPAPARESDDAAIRRAIGTYERAIESKDLALFRSVRPDLSADEERRLRASFEQVTRQQIDIRIETITVTGDTATARLARQDTVDMGGRSQTSRSTQTLRLARRNADWIIVELGR
jgi:hypothetical protein